MPWKECHVVNNRLRVVLLEHNPSNLNRKVGLPPVALVEHSGGTCIRSPRPASRRRALEKAASCGPDLRSETSVATESRKRGALLKPAI
jgi:hypothetical protein